MKTTDKTTKKINRIKTADNAVNFVIRSILLLLIIFIASALWDVYAPNDKTFPYHEEPWIYIHDTHIDYKIVQGKDNFEYLSKNPNRDFYVGGSIFLDYRNNKDFKDEYNIIYGHNMEGGKMFSDIPKFFEKKFFDSHKWGTLYLKDRIYKLKIIGVLKCDAYVNGIFHPRTINGSWVKEFKNCKYSRGYHPGDKILAMSTCASSMDDMRDVVFTKIIED